ncbi:MAG: arginase family protein [Acidobacteriota bacterium]|nr:MAG: arginase family protein [Acidobacteriota bacterium]
MIPPAQLPEGRPRAPRAIDPNASNDGAGSLFGLGLPLEECRIVAVPVPFEGTVSGAGGTVDGPRALIEASSQIDLADPWAGEPWIAGIGSLPELHAIRQHSDAARRAAAKARRGDAQARTEVDRHSTAVRGWVEDTVARLIDRERIPFVIGGEHGISAGAFAAAAQRAGQMGILQIDAHADLRAAYEGWTSSHACVMRRALEIEAVTRLVQVALRDVCPEETQYAAQNGARVKWFTDQQLAHALLEGRCFAELVGDILEALPDRIWLSVDVDGLEPFLCPGTGTPVPGGLSWQQLAYLLGAVGRSGRHIVGADLVEIGPDFWDGFVAAKTLYLLAGVALGTVPDDTRYV